jgi:hypothetical protein
MAKTHRNRGRGTQDDQGKGEGYEHEREPFDDPDEHLEIERRRFRGGLPPTPELYARAREQWKNLPGALSKPPMGEGVPDPGDDQPPPPPKTEKDGSGGER